jgi:sugar phosphate isomerase/epimerase
MTRRDLLFAPLALALPLKAAPRKWQLGINTYCLRFQRWDDRQLIDWCVKEKLDAIFLQDSLDPGVRDPKHWAEVKAWSKDTGLHLETGGSAMTNAVNPKKPDDRARTIAELRMNISRAAAMGSPFVRTLVAGDRYMLPDGSLERSIENAVGVLREVRSQAMDLGIKIAIENHKDLQAWETRTVIETAGKEFVGSYLDTGNPVFVAEDPMTTVETLGPYALSFHLRDSVVYETPGGIAIQWVPLGTGTVDFKAIVAKAAEVLSPSVYVYCKPITARPPDILPVYDDVFWTKYFPRARSQDFARFLALAKRGKPFNEPQVLEDVNGQRDRFMDALKIQQIDHMERSLKYCRETLDLGQRWRG